MGGVISLPAVWRCSPPPMAGTTSPLLRRTTLLPARRRNSSLLVRETASLVDVMGHDPGRAHLPPQRHSPPLLSDIEVQHLGDSDRVRTAADCRPHIGPAVLAGVIGDRGHRQRSGERRAKRRRRARRLQWRKGTGLTGTRCGYDQRRNDQQRQDQAKEPHDCSSAHWAPR